MTTFGAARGATTHRHRNQANQKGKESAYNRESMALWQRQPYSVDSIVAFIGGIHSKQSNGSQWGAGNGDCCKCCENEEGRRGSAVTAQLCTSAHCTACARCSWVDYAHSRPLLSYASCVYVCCVAQWWWISSPTATLSFQCLQWSAWRSKAKLAFLSFLSSPLFLFLFSFLFSFSFFLALSRRRRLLPFVRLPSARLQQQLQQEEC